MFHIRVVPSPFYYQIIWHLSRYLTENQINTAGTAYKALPKVVEVSVIILQNPAK